jgi:hypothetical protein
MKENFLKVEGDLFVKDKKNGAILAVNKNILMQNEARKKMGKKMSSNDTEKIEELSNDMTEIKSLLKTLIQKKD